MAYAVYGDLQMKTVKPVQYYPEEYDYQSYYDNIVNVKSNYPPTQNAKKCKKTTPSVINYENEKKCPIYVHHFNKIPNPSTYNNYLGKSVSKNVPEKPRPSKPKKVHNPKSVLDQLEESYWATWKPNRENVNKTRKTKVHESRSNKGYGDTSETLVKYFASSDFDITTVSVTECSHGENTADTYKLETKTPQIILETEKSQKLVTTSTQEIQTEVLPKIEEQAECRSNIKSTDNGNVAVTGTVIDLPENTSSQLRSNHTIEMEDKSDTEAETKTLKHIDSFIITKKKQGEVKERFQQPKCIKLYRKPGTSMSFLRGGSYPLKPCLKREPVQKSNFKLGAPGSPILVTTNSYNRKSRK